MRLLVSLAQVKILLGEYYPESLPLRALMKKIDAAVNSLKSWR